MRTNTGITPKAILSNRSTSSAWEYFPDHLTCLGTSAEIALKAAQTGHLVLSTLHTNDCISAVTRLLDLGLPAFQIASSITGIIAQRLIRRLCTCRKSAPISPEFTAQLLQYGITSPPHERFTTLEEVQRVVPIDQVASINGASCLREPSSAFAFRPYCGEKRTAQEAPLPPQTAVELGVVSQ